ncbi:hypothetical protein [Microbulbifer sp. A4B17]|uniref:hypothetical protein n=1 Tax=Microbulbifer sp. A4B17 TaxID=359370 RepID=UPI001300BC7F|nr:hypothetical protein [Microbulbifer sp. A4B17]
MYKLVGLFAERKGELSAVIEWLQLAEKSNPRAGVKTRLLALRKQLEKAGGAGD